MKRNVTLDRLATNYYVKFLLNQSFRSSNLNSQSLGWSHQSLNNKSLNKSHRPTVHTASQAYQSIKQLLTLRNNSSQRTRRCSLVRVARKCHASAGVAGEFLNLAYPRPILSKSTLSYPYLRTMNSNSYHFRADTM